MKTNYYALAVSICRGWVPELTFAQMLNQSFKAVDYADDMKALKQAGLYWKDIGELFGVTDSAAYRAALPSRKEWKYGKHCYKNNP